MGKKIELLKGGIFGAIIGAVAGLLLAPKSGKETRKDIKKTATKVASQAEKDLKKLHTELQEAREKGLSKLDSLSGKAKKDLSELLNRADLASVKIREAISILREGDGEVLDLEQVKKDGTTLKDKIAKKLQSKN